MTIPKPAIDATIGQLEHLASAVQDRLAAQAGDDNETWWTVDQVLAALLDGAEVREEWGCRLTIPDGEIPDCWRESREAAEAMASWHINNQSIATPALIRRLHLTLAAEVMEMAALGGMGAAAEEAALVADGGPALTEQERIQKINGEVAKAIRSNLAARGITPNNASYNDLVAKETQRVNERAGLSSQQARTVDSALRRLRAARTLGQEVIA